MSHPRMTVEYLIKQLKEFDDRMEVRFATSPDEIITLLSIYEVDEDNILWLDVEISPK